MTPVEAVTTGSPPRLARTLVRLKLRLLANRARRSLSARLQLAVASLFALLVGAGLGLAMVGAGLAGAGGHERFARVALIGGATLLTLVWTLGPLLTFGVDETLDPARLVLLPLRPRSLVRALLAASFVGPAPTVGLLAGLGAVVGYAGGGGWPVAVPAVVLALLLSATAGRTLATVLAAGLTSRRGRDLTILVASVLGLALQGVRFVRFDQLDPDLVVRAADGLRWLPPGMLAQAVIDARAGRPALGLVELVPAALAVPLLLRWWARALDRSMTVVSDGASPGRRRAGAHRALPLLFDRLPVIPATPWGAVAAKELRYARREPRRKVLILNSVVFGLAMALWATLGGGRDGRSVLLATVAGYIAVINSANQFGFDGAARWIDVVAGDTARATLVGKNVAQAVVIVPAVLVIAVVAAALTGGWVYVPSAVVLAVGGLGAGLGMADLLSAYAPVPLPASQNPFAGRGGGQGCVTSLTLAAGILALNVLLLPVGLGAFAAAAFAPRLVPLVAAGAVVYGGGLWWVGLTAAARRVSSHQSEILVAVDPRREA
jgi:ABC-2 type transport system permease protein